MAACRASLAILAFLPALLTSDPVRAGMMRFESSPSGELGLVARGVTITDALDAVAKRAGFEVLAEEGLARPLVNLTVPTAPVEDLLHEMLRGRNYAFVYDRETASLSQVILLAPSTSGRSGAPPRRAGQNKARSPVIIRN